MLIRKIAYCTDFSHNAEIAFEAALETAQKFDAKLTILHALPPVINPVLTDMEMMLPDESRESLVQKLEQKMRDVYGSRIPGNIAYQLVVLDGHVSSTILQYLTEHNIDLVILGAYGLSGVELVLFGSVAKRIAHKAPCSVLIIREKQKVTS
jgi:universal stress protein A